MTPSMAKTIWKLNGPKTLRFGQQVLPGENVIYCADENSDKYLLNHQLEARNTVLIYGSEKALKIFYENYAKVYINMRVYFLSNDTGMLKESYYVNGQTVTNELGKVVGQEFEWTTNIKDTLPRRANFHGSSFKVVGYQSAPLIFFSKHALSNVKWREDRKKSMVGYVHHKQAKGTFADTLGLVRQDLNFTTTVVLRQDGNIGYPVMVNGSFRGINGMIGDLMSGDVDMILAPVAHTWDRYGFMDFSHAISSLTNSLLVDVNAGSEDQGWLTYLHPFETRLWISLCLNSLLAVFAINLVQVLCTKSCSFQRLGSVLGDYWMIFMSYFGKPPQSDFTQSMLPLKVMMYLIFLSGNLVFISYKAALTTELSTRRHLLPFESPKGFYESNYK